jgi:hypothetical protein
MKKIFNKDVERKFKKVITRGTIIYLIIIVLVALSIYSAMVFNLCTAEQIEASMDTNAFRILNGVTIGVAWLILVGSVVGVIIQLIRDIKQKNITIFLERAILVVILFVVFNGYMFSKMDVSEYITKFVETLYVVYVFNYFVFSEEKDKRKVVE